MRDEPSEPLRLPERDGRAPWHWATQPELDVEPQRDVARAPTAPMRPSGIVFFFRQRKASRQQAALPDSRSFRGSSEVLRPLKRPLKHGEEALPNAPRSAPPAEPSQPEGTGRPPRSQPGARRPAGRGIGTLAAALLLVLVGALGLAVSRWDGWAGWGAESPVYGRPAATSTPASHARLSNLPASTPAQYPTTTPSPFGRPSPTDTSATRPALAVAPTQMTMPITACLTGGAQFMVRNSGGGELTWTASASVPASIASVTPGGGTLAGGAQEPVVVQALALTGHITVTITAAGADQSPQTVTITCDASIQPTVGRAMDVLR